MNATTTISFAGGEIVNAGEVAATNAWTGHTFGGPFHQEILASRADGSIEFISLHA